VGQTDANTDSFRLGGLAGQSRPNSQVDDGPIAQEILIPLRRVERRLLLPCYSIQADLVGMQHTGWTLHAHACSATPCTESALLSLLPATPSIALVTRRDRAMLAWSGWHGIVTPEQATRRFFVQSCEVEPNCDGSR
jgi:hypothetical protein